MLVHMTFERNDGIFLIFFVIEFHSFAPDTETVFLINNSSTSFCLRTSSCRTVLSIHFQQSRPTTIWMVFLVTLTLSSSTFYYEADHRKCEITLRGWLCGLRLFKLGRPLHISHCCSSTIYMYIGAVPCFGGQS